MNEIGIIEFDYENNVICIYQEKEWHDYSTSELKDYLNDINVELQAYKDKEDKLREYITNKTHFMTENGIQYMCNSDDLLQILNEGSDE